MAPRSGGWPDPQEEQRDVVVAALGYGGLEQRKGARLIVAIQERLDRAPLEQIGQAVAADQIARAVASGALRTWGVIGSLRASGR